MAKKNIQGKNENNWTKSFQEWEGNGYKNKKMKMSLWGREMQVVKISSRNCFVNDNSKFVKKTLGYTQIWWSNGDRKKWRIRKRWRGKSMLI